MSYLELLPVVIAAVLWGSGDRFTKGRKRRRKCTLKNYDRFTNS